jgi:hypothetical protein
MDTKDIFRPDRKQALAVVAMIAAVFTFAAGEVVIGSICFGAAAVLSLGGLFWSAHRADRAALLAASQARAGTEAGGAATQPQSRADAAPPASASGRAVASDASTSSARSASAPPTKESQ